MSAARDSPEGAATSVLVLEHCHPVQHRLASEHLQVEAATQAVQGHARNLRDRVSTGYVFEKSQQKGRLGGSRVGMAERLIQAARAAATSAW